MKRHAHGKFSEGSSAIKLESCSLVQLATRGIKLSSAWLGKKLGPSWLTTYGVVGPTSEKFGNRGDRLSRVR